MFRKPKRKLAKSSLRRKNDEDETDGPADLDPINDDDKDEDSTRNLLEEARKRVKIMNSSSNLAASTTTTRSKEQIMHTYQSAPDSAQVSGKDLVTSTAQHHPDELLTGGSTTTTSAAAAGTAVRGDDGIFRDKTRNKFHAGPIRAASSVRVTARFDYQPDICKDYKETGFCGFGDTCIYLHDRGDTLTGWQLEQQWEEEQKAKRAKQEAEVDTFLGQSEKGITPSALPDDGLPFACHICREYFKNPVVTNCRHYFCQACIFDHVRNGSEQCPICNKDTHGVFNQPTKLLAKKKKLLGMVSAKEEGSWVTFFEAQMGGGIESDEAAGTTN